jgi:hypothetical protein
LLRRHAEMGHSVWPPRIPRSALAFLTSAKSKLPADAAGETI